MRIIGCDPDSKSFTFAIIDTDPPGIITARVQAVGRRAEDRFYALVKQASVFLKHLVFPVTWMYIEVPMVGPNRKAAIDQGMALGALRALLLERDIPHSLVSVGTWKKGVIGTGAATKEEIKRWAIQHYGLDSKLLQDYYDATAIAHFGVRSTN